MRAYAPNMARTWQRCGKPAFPDSVFVEDPALVFAAGAILLRPSSVSRKGEVDLIAPALQRHFQNLMHLRRGSSSLLDEDTILTTKRLSLSGTFSGFRQIVVPEGEEAAANALRINDCVFVADDFPKTIALLRDAGYNIVPLPTSQIRKIDAGLSCMLLRWYRCATTPGTS